MSELSIDRLLAMSPIFDGHDLVSVAARQLFLSHVRSQPCVQEVFFPDHEKEKNYEDFIDPSWFDFETFAILYVSQAICRIKDEFKIHSLLHDRKIDELLQDICTSPDWKKVGFSLYTMLFQDLVKDEETHTPFRAYVENDRQKWAQQLSERCRDSKWIYSLIRPIAKGQYSDTEYNRDINILFIKLHLLDPTTVMPTYDYLRKALPDLNLELVTTNYLGDPLSWTLIKTEVELAINKVTYAENASKLSFEEQDTYRGIRVLEFIMQEPKSLGLWTGKYADNRRVSYFKDRCWLM